MFDVCSYQCLTNESNVCMFRNQSSALWWTLETHGNLLFCMLFFLQLYSSLREYRAGKHKYRAGKHENRLGKHEYRLGKHEYRLGKHKYRLGKHEYRFGKHANIE